MAVSVKETTKYSRGAYHPSLACDYNGSGALAARLGPLLRAIGGQRRNRTLYMDRPSGYTLPPA